MSPDHTRRRVLIVAINYAPEPSGTAPYTTAMAEHLAENHDVTALVGMPHYPGWRIADGYSGRMFATERRNGVLVVRRGHFVPTRQTALQRAAYEGTFVLSALTALPRIRRPDVILGIVPSLNGAVLARLFAARFRMPYGLLFHDLMGKAAVQSGITGGGPVRRLTTWLEGSAAGRAALVASVADRFFPYLVDLGVDPSRLVHVPNWTHIGPSIADRETTRASLGWADDEFVVLHAGNMGLKQHLEQVIAAAAAMPTGAARQRIRFVLMGDGSQRPRLEGLAQGVAGIGFMDSVGDRAYSDTLAAADLLLVSERPSAIEMSLPSKLTSYFAAGRPVLAAVPPGGATAREVERAGGGVVVPAGDTGALLAAVAALVADPNGRARYSASGQRYAQSSLRAADALDRVDGFIERLAAVAPPRPSRT